MLRSRCADAAGLLAAYVDDELSALEAGRLRAHLEVCAACRSEAARYRRALGALASAPVPETPRDMLAGVHARLAGEQAHRRPAPLRLRWAAAACALFVLGAAGAAVRVAWVCSGGTQRPTVAALTPAPAMHARPAPRVADAAPVIVPGGQAPPRVVRDPFEGTAPAPPRVRGVTRAGAAPGVVHRLPRPRRATQVAGRTPGERAPTLHPARLAADPGMTPMADEYVRIGPSVTHVRTATGQDGEGRTLVRVDIETGSALTGTAAEPE